MGNNSHLVRSLVDGAVAGLIATGPMTAVMVLCKQMLPRQDQYSLPPEQIVEDLAEAGQVEELLAHPQKEPIVWSAHYGYGALMGLLYGALVQSGNQRSIQRGMAYGLGVWAANYLVALPAANMRAGAHGQSAARNAMMIVSHLAWGAALEEFRSFGCRYAATGESDDELPGHRKRLHRGTVSPTSEGT